MHVRVGAVCLALASPWASSVLARADSPAAKIVVVEVSADATELDAAKLRADIGSELAAVVVAPADVLASQARGTIVVSIDHAAHTLVVSYREDGAPITRSIDLPGDPAETERATVHLAGNLARDEAGELVASLRKSKPPPEGTGDPASAPAPPVDDESANLEQLGLRAARSEHRSRKYLGLANALFGGLGAALWVPTVASNDHASSKEKPAFAAALGVLVVADTAMLTTGVTLLVTEGPIESALHEYEASTGYKVKTSGLREVVPRVSLTPGGGVFGVGGNF